MLPAAKEIPPPKPALRQPEAASKASSRQPAEIPNYPRLCNDAGYLKLVYLLFPKFLSKEKLRFKNLAESSA
jgi:hypothetical protein